MTAKKKPTTADAQAKPVALQPREIPPPPAGLKAAGLEVWSLCETYDFGEAAEKLLLLAQAARTADVIDRLQRIVDESDDLRTLGSAKNIVGIPELGALVSYRSQFAALVKALGCPDDEDGVNGKLTRSQAGRVAARARWGN